MGKTMPVPRLECMYGDEGCNYLYSNSVLLEPLPWTAELQELRSLSYLYLRLYSQGFSKFGFDHTLARDAIAIFSACSKAATLGQFFAY